MISTKAIYKQNKTNNVLYCFYFTWLYIFHTIHNGLVPNIISDNKYIFGQEHAHYLLSLSLEWASIYFFNYPKIPRKWKR